MFFNMKFHHKCSGTTMYNDCLIECRCIYENLYPMELHESEKHWNKI